MKKLLVFTFLLTILLGASDRGNSKDYLETNYFAFNSEVVNPLNAEEVDPFNFE